jgi:cbb3-type cytochrome oxidase subunit 3
MFEFIHDPLFVLVITIITLFFLAVVYFVLRKP